MSHRILKRWHYGQAIVDRVFEGDSIIDALLASQGYGDHLPPGHLEACYEALVRGDEYAGWSWYRYSRTSIPNMPDTVDSQSE